MQITEKYRPDRLSDVVGQDRAVRTIERLHKGGELAGEAYWISGPTGIGKTTLARIIAGMVASEAWMIEETDASEYTLCRLRDIAQAWQSFGMGNGGRAFIVNEAHGLKPDAMRKLLDMMEPIPPHVVIIFTTTKEGESQLFDRSTDAKPLISRCISLTLSSQGLRDPMAERLQLIAQLEELDGKPIEAYRQLMKKNNNNIRAALQAIKAGKMLD